MCILFSKLLDFTSSTVCSPNYFGPNCAKCHQKCQSCDPITGKCTKCHSSLYGEYCQHNCPPNCLDLLCNPATGVCNGCKIGFKGNHCEQEMTSLGLSTGIKESYTRLTINILYFIYKVVLLCISNHRQKIEGYKLSYTLDSKI